MAHTYFVMRRPEHADRLLVWDTRTLTIGRAKENDIVVADGEISRRHVIFKKEGNRFVVGDYQTGNGTFINGQRIAGTEPQPLQSGDLIAIATLLEFEFYDGDAHPAKRGLKLEYASHLKTVGLMPAGANPNANPNATMLGMADSVPAVDEDFVIERSSRDEEVPEVELDLVAPPPKEIPALEFEDDDLGLGSGSSASATASASTTQSETRVGGDPIERMRRLKSLHAEGLITDAEFERKRAQILENI
jgi:predicted component of type VI protein secretion system